MSDPLFSDVDPRPVGDGCDDAPPRYETAHRDQIELQPCDLEALLPPGHAARLVWRFVEGLDLSAFYAAIRAREGRAGRPPIDPKILRVAHDGTRVRGSAGAASFRRGETLQECARPARKQVERVQKQADTPVHARTEAAQQRAAADRMARVEEALAQLPAIEATNQRQTGKRPTEARVSTTDPDARVMKMADGGYRPAYNVQLATDVDSRAIVGVAVTNLGSDRSSLIPMLGQRQARTGRVPGAALVESGCVTRETITEAAAQGVTVYAPLSTRRGGPTAQPTRTDSPALREWRQRMETADAQALYRQRAATAEWVNADARAHRTLTPIPVRGLTNVHTWALWIALAHNMVRTLEIVPRLMT